MAMALKEGFGVGIICLKRRSRNRSGIYECGAYILSESTLS